MELVCSVAVILAKRLSAIGEAFLIFVYFVLLHQCITGYESLIKCCLVCLLPKASSAKTISPVLPFHTGQMRVPVRIVWISRDLITLPGVKYR